MNSLEDRALDTLRDNCKTWEEYKYVETSLKALEIIKKKRVDVDVLLNCKTLEDFNGAMKYTHLDLYEQFALTQEEFEILKKELEK